MDHKENLLFEINRRSQIRVISAKLEHLDGIMRIEEETYGKIEAALDPEETRKSTTAGRDLMASRIGLLNHPRVGRASSHFWVAKASGDHSNEILGYVTLQPTHLQPNECDSWDKSTDFGTFRKSFHPNGPNLYAVSLGVRTGTPAETFPRLALRAFRTWSQKYSEGVFMLCARVPGFARAQEADDTLTIENYWNSRHANGTYKDGMIQMFSSVLDSPPKRLLKNGWPVDKDSKGHGVLFAAEDPDSAIAATSQRILKLIR